MNKKGMTLIELMAVIAIIAIITLMVAPDVINIRERSIRSTLDNKVLRIESAALKYANDNVVNVPSNFFDPGLRYDTADNISCIESKNSTLEDGYDCTKYCLIVYVNALIQLGYLSGDNEGKTDIIHPLSNESMNSQKVCIRYDTSKITVGKTASSDTTTEITDSNTGRKIFAYILDEGDLYDDFEQ